MSKNYFMVRTKEIVKENSNSDIINVGWGRVDLSKAKFEEINNQIKEEYLLSKCAIQVGRELNQIKRFMNIRGGDIIITPFGSSIMIAVAKCKYHENNEFGNKLVVEFYKDKNGCNLNIPRNELSEKFQRRLRVRGTTVADYQEFASEINKIINSENYQFFTEISVAINSDTDKFKENLLYNIRNGNTHLQTGGIGLEKLVRELVEIDGYDARINAKTAFTGKADADITAEKTDYLFGDIKVLIQVKHHTGLSDDYGINQLKLIKESGLYDFDYLVFVTSAKISDENRNLAEKVDIKVIDGDELINWIYDDIDKLSDDTLYELGISTTPHLINIPKMSH